MKKKYIKPELAIVEVELQAMMTFSTEMDQNQTITSVDDFG